MLQLSAQHRASFLDEFALASMGLNGNKRLKLVIVTLFYY